MTYNKDRAEEWRQARSNPRSLDNRFMLDLGPLHDATFVVGLPGCSELITCHKLILARCSTIFSEMFFSRRDVFTYDDEEPIFITDCQPQAFDTMIEYIYSGELYVQDCNVAGGVLYAAKKYMLPDLVEKCRSFLWAEMYPDHVMQVLQCAKDNDEPELFETALQVVQRRTSRVLQTTGWLQATTEAVVILVKQSNLTIVNELELYHACVAWSREEAKRRGVSPHPSTLQDILSPVVHYLRLFGLSPKKLSKVKDEDILTVDPFEFEGDTRAHFTAEFSSYSRPRSPPQHETFYTIGYNDECLHQHMTKEYFENSYDVFSSAFTSSGDFCSTQLGVRIPTQLRPAESHDTDYEEHLTLLFFDLTHNRILCVTHFNQMVPYNTIIDIPFSSKIQLDKQRVQKVAKVVFHKSGHYPVRYKTTNNKFSEFITCNFGDTENAKLFHKTSFGFIHFCAYTIDKN